MRRLPRLSVVRRGKLVSQCSCVTALHAHVSDAIMRSNYAKKSMLNVSSMMETTPDMTSLTATVILVPDLHNIGRYSSKL